jgi:hypothetical protein
MLERDKAAALERCLVLQRELEACTQDRDRLLAQLDGIRQDPELYFSGLASGGGPQGGGGVASAHGGIGIGSGKRLSQASSCSAASADDASVDFDEQDVDFE